MESSKQIKTGRKNDERIHSDQYLDIILVSVIYVGGSDRVLAMEFVGAWDSYGNESLTGIKFGTFIPARNNFQSSCEIGTTAYRITH